MSRFLDDTSLPAPGSKKGKGILITVLSLLGIGLLVVFIKAGSATKDPKKAAVDASKVDRTETGEATSRSAQSAAGDLVGADGAHRSTGETTEKDIKERIDKNLRAANQAELDHEREEYKKRKEEERRREGLPGSVDAQGRPVDAQGQPGQPGATRKPVIPEFASGWNPEQDIIAPQADGLPSYRYIPAYLRGTNNPSESKQLRTLDQHWLESIGKPSYGASMKVQDDYNKDAPSHLSVGRAARVSGPIPTSGVMVRQAPGQTPIECTAPASRRPQGGNQ